MYKEINIHTKMCLSIRAKLKRMISLLPIPEVIEKYILDFVGLPIYKYKLYYGRNYIKPY